MECQTHVKKEKENYNEHFNFNRESRTIYHDLSL